MMSGQTDKITQFFKKFGLGDEDSSIYVYLLKAGEKSALDISRNNHIGRTKVYRILEKLMKKGLVNEKMDSHGKRFEASSIDKLDMLVKEKESELESMRKSKDKIIKHLSFFEAKRDKKSKVLYYTGKEGLKQITWNSLKAKNELFIFETGQTMNPFVGRKFAEKMREEFFIRKIVTKQLTNYKKIKAFTEFEQYVKNCCEIRYIDPKELSFDFEILIYNDIVAIYTYKDKEYFGIEIINDNLASMQKQIFSFIWSKGKKMKISKGGKAEV